MTEKEFYDKLLSGVITIDENGHNPFYGWGSEHFLEEIKNSVELHKNFDTKRYDECLIELKTCPIEQKEEKEKELERHRKSMNQEYEMLLDEYNRISYSWHIQSTGNCQACGGRIGWQFLEQENKLKCIIVDWSKYRLSANNDKSEISVDDSICKFNYKSKITTAINVFDNLVFENFFNYSEDYPHKSKKHDDEYSLNTHAGRINIANVHASRNVAYAQMATGIFYIYVNIAKDEILVVSEKHIWNEEIEKGFDAEELLNKAGYILIGNFGCTVWRWMAANKSDLVKHEYSSKEYNKRDDDPVEVEGIKHGVWEIDHYYGTDDHNALKIAGVTIASHLKLKK